MVGLNLFGGGALTNPKQGINAAQRGFNQQSAAIKEGSQNLQDYNQKANEALREGQASAQDFLRGGVASAQPYLQQASGLYSGLAPGDLSARAMYLNALGLNGAGGTAKATNAFQNSPGFQYALQMANQNVMRNQSNLGALNSGNTLQALSDRAQELQNQDWGNWLNRLSDQGNNVYQDYSGQARALGGLASLFNDYGQNAAGVATGTGTNLSNNYMNTGRSLNSNDIALGNAAQQRQQDIFGAQASAAANSAAQNQALWNGALGLGQSLIGLL